MDLDQKKALFAELLLRLRREHQTLVAAQRATHEGATHEEARPENDKDTRALEQSYLARGQAARTRDLEDDVHTLSQLVVRSFGETDPISLGALVETDDGDKVAHYLLSPVGAGEQLDSAEGYIKIVTPESPLGRALIGCRADDDVEVKSPTGKRILSVLSVC